MAKVMRKTIVFIASLILANAIILTILNIVNIMTIFTTTVTICWAYLCHVDRI